MSDAAAGPPDRPKKSASSAIWRAGSMLAAASLVATAAAAAVVGLVLHGDFLTGAAESLARLMFEHSALAVAAAASPIFAALLVGYGYMQRGIRRRAAEKAAAGGPGAAATSPSRCRRT